MSGAEEGVSLCSGARLRGVLLTERHQELNVYTQLYAFQGWAGAGYAPQGFRASFLRFISVVGDGWEGEVEWQWGEHG